MTRDRRIAAAIPHLTPGEIIWPGKPVGAFGLAFRAPIRLTRASLRNVNNLRCQAAATARASRTLHLSNSRGENSASTRCVCVSWPTKAVCRMALMDMSEITPIFRALAGLLPPDGAFVFSVTHPRFHSASIQHVAETHEDERGRHHIRAGVKVLSYLSPTARKTEGIVGQPAPQFFFHRPLGGLFHAGLTGSSSMVLRSQVSPPEIGRMRGSDGRTCWRSHPSSSCG